MAIPPSHHTPSPSLLEVVGMAIDSLRNNRLRTGLTMLGMIIGIGAVITVTSVGRGAQKSVEQQIQSLGSNVLTVMAGASSRGGISQGIGSASTLTWEDAKVAAEQVTLAEAVSAYLQKAQTQVVYGSENTTTTIIGTDLNYPKVKNIYPQQGQFFTQDELDAALSVAVLGSKVRDQLFSQENAIGLDIRIQGKRYRVIGVMESKGAGGIQDQDDSVYIPLTNMSSELVGNNALSGIAITGFVLSTRNTDELDAAQFQVSNLLRLRHDIYPPQADDFNIINQVNLIDTLGTIISLFTVMVTAIAGISLVVGGIGIANIMLVSVVERTREIGIRKALGATRSAILSQFLVEAVVVSAIGGGIGVIFGIGVSIAASLALSIPLVISLDSIAAGLTLSVGIGLLAGVIPAQSAAKLDPIVALRSE
ncbi:MAG: ABC transporter permease [Oscillatoriophycideae cyanobacterium NC_groundwater_1537_Pr4_S-0.65um_50_18]|nr:ABC transporter permease [Oscillatoriophycideae cyanobacterium NC_groundwater_1537_Pr4_S-0.65um_50_18]